MALASGVFQRSLEVAAAGKRCILGGKNGMLVYLRVWIPAALFCIAHSIAENLKLLIW
jgi:hypothetical protein